MARATTTEQIEPGATGKAVLTDDLWQPLEGREPVEVVNTGDSTLYEGSDIYLDLEND